MSMRPLSAWLEGLPEYQALRNSLSEPSSGPIALAVARSIRPLIVAALWQQTRRPTLYVTSSVEASRQAADAVRTLCGIDIAESLSLIRLVEPNTSFYDSVAPVIDVVTQRTAALARLSPMTRGIGVPPQCVAHADVFEAEMGKELDAACRETVTRADDHGGLVFRRVEQSAQMLELDRAQRSTMPAPIAVHCQWLCGSSTKPIFSRPPAWTAAITWATFS